jgi:hypothetical protein
MIWHAMIELFILLMNDKMNRSLHTTPAIEAFLWSVSDTHLISISQVPTHAQLDLGGVIEEAKQAHQKNLH